MKIKINPSIERLINIIDHIIDKNRETLPESDLLSLCGIKDELLKITEMETGNLKTEMTVAIGDIAKKLLRFFIDNKITEWMNEIN